MNARDFLRCGVLLGEASRHVTDFVAHFALAGGNKSRLQVAVAVVVANPTAFVDDPLCGAVRPIGSRHKRV